MGWPGFGWTVSLAVTIPGVIYAYLGTYTEGRRTGIFVYRYDPSTGALEAASAVETLSNPTFLAIHPSKRFLYAVSEVGDYDGQTQTAASAFAIDPASGGLKLLNHMGCPGQGACHATVDPSSRYVILANYGDGSVTVLPIMADGRLGQATDFVQHTGHGPHPNQAGPHAHSTTFSPDRKIAFVADLGTDKLMAYRLDGEPGKLAPHRIPFLSLTSGAGPRHADFHPNVNEHVGYIIDELDNTLVAVDFDAATGELRPKQTLSTLPSDFGETSYAADIHVHPSGRWVYGSNRGHDSIVIFNIGATGLLTVAGHQPVGGHWPRNFAIDPAGRYMLVANQKSDNVVAFAINRETGLLSSTGFALSVKQPVCIKFIALD